jgi:hypothetical protein
MKSLKVAAIVALALFATSVQPAGKPGIADFDWIGGHWCGGTAPERIEEYWMPARGGMLIGMGRTTRAERTLSFEFMRIVAADSPPAFIAQPNGAAAVSFKWSAGGANWARFENPAHDFPKRVEYRRDGDRLHAEIAGPGDGGKEKIIPFDYQRCEAR